MKNKSGIGQSFNDSFMDFLYSRLMQDGGEIPSWWQRERQRLDNARTQQESGLPMYPRQVPGTPFTMLPMVDGMGTMNLPEYEHSEPRYSTSEMRYDPTTGSSTSNLENIDWAKSQQGNDILTSLYFGAMVPGSMFSKPTKTVAGKVGQFGAEMLNPGMKGMFSKPKLSTFDKNINDLNYAKEQFSKYAYDIPKDLEIIAKSNEETDKVIKGLVNQHNTFVRGVSTNWDEIGKRNPEILRHLEGKGIDWKNNPQQAAEYMATHVPINTGYGRAGLNNEVFNRGLDGLYTSNSISTAEGYTYGQGYVVKAKRPTDFTSTNRKNWIDDNSLNYIDNDINNASSLDNAGKFDNRGNLINEKEILIERLKNLDSKSFDTNIKIGSIVFNKDLKEKPLTFLGYNKGNLFNKGHYKYLSDDGVIIKDKDAYSLKYTTKDIEDYVKARKIKDEINDRLKVVNKNIDLSNQPFNLLKTEHRTGNENIDFNDILNKYIVSKGGNPMSSVKGNTLGDKILQDVSQIQREVSSKFNFTDDPITNREIERISNQQSREAVVNYMKQYSDFDPVDRYAHYIHLGTPGQKVLEPIESIQITPDIWKNKSRAHTNIYSKGLSAGSLALPVVGASQISKGNNIEQEIPEMRDGGQINNLMNSFTEFNTGSHDSGKDKKVHSNNAAPYAVENKEIKWDNYIFSDNLTVPGSKKTFANATKSLKPSPNDDDITRKTKQMELHKYMQMQEKVKAEKDIATMRGGGIPEFAFGGDTNEAFGNTTNFLMSMLGSSTGGRDINENAANIGKAGMNMLMPGLGEMVHGITGAMTGGKDELEIGVPDRQFYTQKKYGGRVPQYENGGDTNSYLNWFKTSNYYNPQYGLSSAKYDPNVLSGARQEYGDNLYGQGIKSGQFFDQYYPNNSFSYSKQLQSPFNFGGAGQPTDMSQGYGMMQNNMNTSPDITSFLYGDLSDKYGFGFNPNGTKYDIDSNNPDGLGFLDKHGNKILRSAPMAYNLAMALQKPHEVERREFSPRYTPIATNMEATREEIRKNKAAAGLAARESSGGHGGQFIANKMAADAAATGQVGKVDEYLANLKQQDMARFDQIMNQADLFNIGQGDRYDEMDEAAKAARNAYWENLAHGASAMGTENEMFDLWRYIMPSVMEGKDQKVYKDWDTKNKKGKK